MATQIYNSGGAINIEGLQTDIISINPFAFDWNKSGVVYSCRDKIENQAYQLGALADIQDKSGNGFSTDAELILYLNSLTSAIGANFDLDVSRGLVYGIQSVHKFGAAPSGIQATATDVWDRADSTPTQQIWVAPTEARIHAIESSSSNDACGVGVLTLSGLPLDTETVTIGSKVYTFQTVLTDVDGNVLIGASASESLDNLIAAINLTAGAGTIYAASMTNPNNVLAAAGSGDTMDLYDNDSLTLATTETLTNGSWGAATITAGTGARTIRVYGLKTWNSAETSEDVVLHGTDPVNTSYSYVIIHRMKVLTAGTSAPNVGAIKATAATDSTITAVILAGNGQTEMAIYGVPSTKSFYIKRWRCNIDKASVAPTSCDFNLKVNESPDVNPKLFLRKNDISVQSDGANMFQSTFDPPIKFSGPCIIKIQGIASGSDIDGESSFDGYLADN
jgi:hypothetical protein